MKDDRLYLNNIKECIENIEFYTIDGKEIFLNNRMIQDAVIRNFEIIGEATKRLSIDFRDKYSDIPWQQMAGFRDVLIHDYLKVNVERVWGVSYFALKLTIKSAETMGNPMYSSNLNASKLSRTEFTSA